MLMQIHRRERPGSTQAVKVPAGTHKGAKGREGGAHSLAENDVRAVVRRLLEGAKAMQAEAQRALKEGKLKEADLWQAKAKKYKEQAQALWYWHGKDLGR